MHMHTCVAQWMNIAPILQLVVVKAGIVLLYVSFLLSITTLATERVQSQDLMNKGPPLDKHTRDWFCANACMSKPAYSPTSQTFQGGRLWSQADRQATQIDAGCSRLAMMSKVVLKVVLMFQR